ncbi:MAG: DUF4149 domain-containing protein, partial [Verrucomicrobiae bacterium]|nr:DUF4149 domain-containing protein [Verrucomicrobiae bacterium]MDW7979307.1 DUF4149 domain-containing protein [Verrucomicrobiales bacterium]
MGLLNAAVWLGSTVFFVLVAAPTLLSSSMKNLLGPNNFPFFAGAVLQLLTRNFYTLQIICGAVALLHMIGEWLYLGRPLRRFNTALLSSLFVLALVCKLLVSPKTERLHRLKHAPNRPAEVTSAAAKSLQVWQGLGHGLNFI